MIRKTLQINAKEAFEVEIFRPPYCSTFCSTGNGHILPFFAFRGKRKTPDFVWKSGVCSNLLFLKVVPPALGPKIIFALNYYWVEETYDQKGRHCYYQSCKIHKFIFVGMPMLMQR